MGRGATCVRRIGRHRARGHPAGNALLLSSPSAMTGGRLDLSSTPPRTGCPGPVDLHTPREGRTCRSKPGIFRSLVGTYGYAQKVTMLSIKKYAGVLEQL
eukprot:5560898-Prymnesium_polylepis.1